jgi:catechol 2,3-dioxygenase
MCCAIHPQFSHCGIYARDIAAQIDFYTRVLGLIVADRGVSAAGQEFVFLTAAPDHHHQLVFISGRGKNVASTVNQLSFKVADLNQLKGMVRRAQEYGIRTIRQICHGNALSFYVTDPEGNGVEVYIDTPWYIPQPHAVPVDLSLGNDAIMEMTEKHCRETPGFLPLAAWRAEVASRLEGAP